MSLYIWEWAPKGHSMGLLSVDFDKEMFSPIAWAFHVDSISYFLLIQFSDIFR